MSFETLKTVLLKAFSAALHRPTLSENELQTVCQLRWSNQYLTAYLKSEYNKDMMVCCNPYKLWI